MIGHNDKEKIFTKRGFVLRTRAQIQTVKFCFDSSEGPQIKVARIFQRNKIRPRPRPPPTSAGSSHIPAPRPTSSPGRSQSFPASSPAAQFPRPQQVPAAQSRGPVPRRHPSQVRPPRHRARGPVLAHSLGERLSPRPTHGCHASSTPQDRPRLSAQSSRPCPRSPPRPTSPKRPALRQRVLRCHHPAGPVQRAQADAQGVPQRQAVHRPPYKQSHEASPPTVPASAALPLCRRYPIGFNHRLSKYKKPAVSTPTSSSLTRLRQTFSASALFFC